MFLRKYKKNLSRTKREKQNTKVHTASLKELLEIEFPIYLH